MVITAKTAVAAIIFYEEHKFCPVYVNSHHVIFHAVGKERYNNTGLEVSSQDAVQEYLFLSK